MKAIKFTNHTPKSFVDSDLLVKLPSKDSHELDTLEFGVIQVDETGVIKFYNKYEAEFEGIPQPMAKGKNYFTQIMPCTCNRIFYERFKMGMLLNNLNYVMPYTFTYRIKPTDVVIHLYRDPTSKTNWILVQKR